MKAEKRRGAVEGKVYLLLQRQPRPRPQGACETFRAAAAPRSARARGAERGAVGEMGAAGYTWWGGNDGRERQGRCW